jgi:hypothetical protein
MKRSFLVSRGLSEMTDEEVLDEYVSASHWWKTSPPERAPLREEILRRMRARHPAPPSQKESSQ